MATLWPSQQHREAQQLINLQSQRGAGTGARCTCQQAAEPLPPAAAASSCSQKSMAQDAAAKATETIRQAPKPSTMLLPT